MPPKRKRAERGGSGDSGPTRPSPHRPGDTALGQHDRHFSEGGGRGGRGGRQARRGDRRDSSQSFGGAAAPVPTAQSPTVARPVSASSQSSSQPPRLPAPTSAVVSSSISNPPELPAYDYHLVTDDRLSRWVKDGRQELANHGIQSRNDEDVSELSTIYQELTRAVGEGRLSGNDAGKIVKDILGPQSAELEGDAFGFDPRTLFLDTISIEMETGEYRPQLAEFMVATDISPMLMRQILDPPLLEKMGLIRSTFGRVGIRLSTNLLYRQANYNLLREETEGYSKLATEIFTTSMIERPPPTSDSVQAAFEKVKGLIGTFDLDVGRVLDVTLDIFATLWVGKYRFFIKFLRISSWWPRSQIDHSSKIYTGGLPPWALPDSYNCHSSEDDEAALNVLRQARDVNFWERARQIHLDAFFELGGRQITDAAAIVEVEANAEDPDIETAQQWIQTTKTLPPPGNRVAAQLLGFKFRFYCSDARDPEDIFLANLFYLTSMLIKVEFISLRDLWPHLWPPEQDYDSFGEKKIQELENEERANRPGGSTNALMTAGALPDDMPAAPSTAARRDATSTKPETDPKAAKETDGQPKLQELQDQREHLCRSLLLIGCIPEALFILGRHPWLIQAYPAILPLIHRILHHSIDKVFQQSQPSGITSAGCPPKPMPDVDQTGVPKGTVKLSAPATKRFLRWPHADNPDFEGGQFRFFWDEWADNVPVCQTIDDLFTLCNTFLNISGVNIGKDPELLAKLANVGSKSLAEDQSPQNITRWQELLRRLLVPALSLTNGNSAVVNAVWKLLKQYPTSFRYTVYAEWYEGQTSRLEPIKKAFARTRLETLSTMKRLSLTNIPQMARTLAKTAYASPGVVFKVALDQIEAYSNLIEAFVECAKYFTELGYDVLVWSLLSSLGGKQRSRTQETSVLLTSKWLQALSRFSGKVFKRYAVMDATPVIQYVNDQLYDGNSTDLVILKELISSMGGIVSDADFTDAQLRAMTGGDVLRRETLKNLGDRREESAKSAARLMRAMVDTKLAGQLLVNVAQYRQFGIYKIPDSEAHIKLLATVVDDSHQVLTQYLDLLRSNLNPEEFDHLVPDIIQLMQNYGLDPSLAFMISRASLISQMKNPKTAKDDTPRPQAVKPATDVDGDVAIGEGASNGAPNSENDTVSAITDGVSGDVDDKVTQPESASSSIVVNGRKTDPFVDALQPIIQAVPSLIGNSDVWSRISPEFFVIFWSLQLGDLVLPQSSYGAEHAKLTKQAEDVMKDRSDMTRVGMNKKSQKKQELQDRAASILAENNQLLERYQKTKILLVRESSTWFPSSMARVNGTSDAILEQCVLPRLQLSAIDAEYAFRMIKFLHESQAPNFKLMSLYDRFFNQNRLRSMIFTCTVREAEHLGRFVKCVLGDLSRWHSDKDVYEKEALGMREKAGKKVRSYLGFATTFDEQKKPAAFIEHDEFRDLLFRWHKNLNTALRSCLGGMEWMHIRNAITILKTSIDYFPAINFMAEKFLEQLKIITDREAASKNASDSEEGHRVDLSVTAQTAFSELQKRKSSWVLVQAFRPGKTGETKEELRSSSSTAGSTLRPTATEFKPAEAVNSTRKPSTAEVEDGEVKDSHETKTTLPAKVGSNSRIRDSTPARLSSTANETPTDHPTSVISGPTSAPRTESKPSTPKPAAAQLATGSASRQEPSKTSTLSTGVHGLPSRPDLPSRPNVPFPGKAPGERFSGHARPQERRDAIPPRETREQRDTRDIRDAREPPTRDPRSIRDSRDPRDSRATDVARPDRHERPERLDAPERPHDSPQSHGRRNVEVTGRDASQPSERDRHVTSDLAPKRTDTGRPHERDQRLPRDSRTSGSSRPQDNRSQRNSDMTTLTPVNSHQPQSSQEPSINPERAHLIETDRSDMINPARAALINDARDPNARSSRDHGRDRSTRTDSPRRSDFSSSSGPPDSSREERHGRPRHSDHHNTGRETQGGNIASHARTERHSDRDSDRNGDRYRDSSAFHGPPSHQSDSNHGRLSHQDPNYGRLNPVQSATDIPSGPRGRGRNSTRVSSATGPPVPVGPPQRGEAQISPVQTNRALSPDRQPPTGPSSSRTRRGQYDGGATSDVPPASSASTAPAGVHPDRLRLVNPPLSGQPDVHSDRGFHNNGPQPPAHGAQSRSIDNLPPANTPDRPAISAGPPSSRSMPSHTPHTPGGNMAAPTGPSSTGDRSRSGGVRQLRGIQTALSQAQADMPASGPRNSNNVRVGGGGGGRRSMMGSDAQILTGASPVSTPVQDRPDPMRSDVSTDHGPRQAEPIPSVLDSRDGRHGNDMSGRGDFDRGNRREPRGERSDRNGRPSRRSSRERSQDREREPRDHRDRRSGVSGGPPPNVGAPVGGNSRDDHAGPPRRSARDSNGPNREMMPSSGREPNNVSNRDHGGPRGYRPVDGPGGGQFDGSSRGGRSDGPSAGVRGGEDYGGGRGGPGRPPVGSGGGGSAGGPGGGGGYRDFRSDRGDQHQQIRDDRGGRKRRSEEGASLVGNDREKRQRR